MMAIGRYLLLIISLAALTITVDGRFSNEDVATFVDYIFRLHNAVRLKHNVLPLTRTENLNLEAFLKLNELKIKAENDEPLGEVSYYMYYDNNTQLNLEEAKRFFSLWYDDGDFYKYEIAPQNEHAVIADDFTQVVWMSTTDIGITFRCNESIYEVLAVYSPPGNILQHYKSNVFRPINDLPATDDEIGLIYQAGKERFLDCLFELHNEARFNHRVLPLEHDDELDDIANSMLQRNREVRTKTFGVNSFAIVRDGNIRVNDELAKKVFSQWYEGKIYYNYHNFYNAESATEYKSPTDAFTQMVWQETRTIGIGVQQDGDTYLIIAVYYPPGNLPGQYASNVFRPRSMDQGESSGNN